MKQNILGLDYMAGLLQDAFNVDKPVILPSMLNSRADFVSGYKNVNLVSEQEADRLSQFGTPVFGSFTTAGGKYLIYEPVTGIPIKKKFAEFEFPLATIVDFQQEKLIEKTPVIGTVGTAKSVYSIGDWDILIRGVCINDTSRKGQITVQEQQAYLIALNEIAGAIDIERGALFLDKEIRSIVIESLKFHALQGNPNVLPFEIKAVSDKDFLLYEKNELPK